MVLIEWQSFIENLQLILTLVVTIYLVCFSTSSFQDRLFNEGVHGEDDSDNDDIDSSFVNRNQYKTLEPHPFLQTAFDLGMMGLEKLKEKPDLLDEGYRHYRRCPVVGDLSEFCRCVFLLSV